MTRSLPPSHAPQGTVCHAVVQVYFQAWLEQRRRTGRPVPGYVEEEFREFLGCGDPKSGVMTVACPTGHYSRCVADRCKGRGFCAYCLTLRQRELGSRLMEGVLRNVPVLHGVLCFPPSIRCTLGYDRKLIDGGFAALTQAMFRYQRRRAAELFGVPRDRIYPGCVAVNHRVSANLRPNHHFHGIFPDGVFIEVGSRLEFRRLPAPSEEDITSIAYEAGLAFCEALKARGFWEARSTSGETIEGILKLPGTRPTPVKFFGQSARNGEGGTAPRDGAYAFHLFVSKAIEVEDRAQLQHLVNYVLAPPFRDDQLMLNNAGEVVLQLKRERHDGTAQVVIRPYEFLDCLADLVPRPNSNSIRYYGIYASRARLRKLALGVRLDESRPVERCRAEWMVCPVCDAELQVVRPSRRSSESLPPDTPSPVIPGRKGSGVEGATDAEQGRLFG